MVGVRVGINAGYGHSLVQLGFIWSQLTLDETYVTLLHRCIFAYEVNTKATYTSHTKRQKDQHKVIFDLLQPYLGLVSTCYSLTWALYRLLTASY